MRAAEILESLLPTPKTHISHSHLRTASRHISLFQHHVLLEFTSNLQDGITGTSTDHVVKDYGAKLTEA